MKFKKDMKLKKDTGAGKAKSGRKEANGKKAPEIQKNWLFLTGEENDAHMINETLKEDYETEIWEDAGVIEIGLPSGSSIDLEEAELNQKDELLMQRMEQEEVQRIFLVTVGSEDWKEAETVLKKMLGELGGIMCADTEQLEPVIRA